ncbi:MAG TPA: endolytic transglycosylase MltG [Acidimicrobiales bacterium]|nr:endolytic transglycosylase MltG [Acidimicrobiales bacterium]
MTRRSLGRRRLRTALGFLALVVVGLVVWGVVWYEGEVSPGPAGPAVIVNVPEGASVSVVTADLARQGVVGSSLAFRIYLILHGTPTVLAGRYQLHRQQGFASVRSALAAGPNVFAVTVLPGTTVSEVAASVGKEVPRHSQSAFAAAARAAPSPWQPAGSDNLDGLLGPGTYLVVPGETDAELVGKMVARFGTEANALGLSAAAAADGLTPYEAITVASIVQKEAISPGDSTAATTHNVGPVARVIYNRLNNGTPLQMDSTVLYAEGRDGGSVTAADLALATPYNTYLHAGLTPTPICFPSAVALRAALHPPPGAWLYFELTSADGTETFSDTFAQQVVAEQLARSRGLP